MTPRKEASNENNRTEGRTVVVLAGMPGAGKSLASLTAKRMGLPVFVSGDVIRHEAETRGLKPTRQNLGRLMVTIRKKEGMGAVAERVKPLIEATRSSIVVYEGARNMEEIEELTVSYTILTVAIHASPKARFRRLLRRKRSDQPMNWKEFVDRDERELRIGLGRVVALADRMIENEGTKDELGREMRRLLKTIRS